MVKKVKIALWAWSALLLINGIITWFNTLGVVYSTEFNLQISILNKIGMLMVWVALYAVWRTLESNHQPENIGLQSESISPE